MTGGADALLEGLNPPQREAVLHRGSPLLVVAGAGTGKTRTLTRRVAHLVASRTAQPWELLAITFTNKAATEMRDRVVALVGSAARDIWIHTFHAACLRILRRHAQALGYPASFSVYDAEDQLELARACLRELDWDEKRWPPAAMVAAVSRAKSELLGPEDAWEEASDYHTERVAVFYRHYQERLRAAGAMDFDDLIRLTVCLLGEHEDILAHWQERFQHVLVDEYQDTNHAQYALVDLLARRHRNLAVVGDSDQSIYGWRNADIRNILDFQRDYPDARVIRLEQNYRSVQPVLEVANALIAHNALRVPKALWTERREGPQPVLYQASSEQGEAAFVASEIARGLGRGRSPGSYAVLYRTHAQSRTFEDELMRRGIPYRVVGGTRFYERREVKDVLAYLKVVANPQDDLSLERILNVPPRGTGEATLARLKEHARALGRPLLECCLQADELEGVPARAARALKELGTLFGDLRGALANTSLPELVRRVIEESGYAAWLLQQATPEALSRLENLQELASMARVFVEESEDPSLEAFLGLAALVADIDSLEGGPGAVVLMTAHNAKGLEFPTVFCVGLEEGLFPHARSSELPEELEEERRLLYVGITRAEQELYLTWAADRTLFGRPSHRRPSRFIAEIPASLLRHLRAEPDVAVRVCRPGLAGRPQGVAPPARAETDFRPGDKVHHPRWGLGTVVSRREQAGDLELTLAFPGLGVKVVLARYAKLTRP